jgi:hypothetical protein
MYGTHFHGWLADMERSFKRCPECRRGHTKCLLPIPLPYPVEQGVMYVLLTTMRWLIDCRTTSERRKGNTTS